MNLQGEGETRYDIIKELESGIINGTELAKVHDVGKVMITDIRKKENDIENYAKHVDFSDADEHRKTLNTLM